MISPAILKLDFSFSFDFKPSNQVCLPKTQFPHIDISNLLKPLNIHCHGSFDPCTMALTRMTILWCGKTHWGHFWGAHVALRAVLNETASLKWRWEFGVLGHMGFLGSFQVWCGEFLSSWMVSVCSRYFSLSLSSFKIPGSKLKTSNFVSRICQKGKCLVGFYSRQTTNPMFIHKHNILFKVALVNLTFIINVSLLMLPYASIKNFLMSRFFSLICISFLILC